MLIQNVLYNWSQFTSPYKYDIMITELWNMITIQSSGGFKDLNIDIKSIRKGLLKMYY